MVFLLRGSPSGDYVLVLANSGIRTGEANKLKVTDVHAFVDDKQRKNFRLVVRGKTGERDAIVRSVAAKRLDNIWQSVVWQIRAGYCSSCLMAHRLHH